MAKKMWKTKQSKNPESGFTVVELMIATLIFSVVLIILTFSFMQISRMFYKGITASRTQETARGIVDELSRTIQFNGGDPPSNTYYIATRTGWFCVNNYRYTYALNKMYSQSTPNNHVFIKDQPAGGCNALSGPINSGNLNVDFTSLPSGTNPEELMRNSMRLANLDTEPIISTANGLYQINIRIIHGDNTVLDTANPPQKCSASRGAGQFCAISNLKTVVQKRI